MSLLCVLPNLVTGLRLIAVPVVVVLIFESAWSAAFWLVVAAGLSDGIDGFLAKRLNAVTRLGTYLDPIADKSLLVAVCLSLTYSGLLPGWIVALVILRDLLIVNGVVLSRLLALDLKVEPILVSKLNTVLQLFLIGLVLGQPGTGLDLPQLAGALIYLVAFTTIVSGTLYLLRWLQGLEAVPEVQLVRADSK